MAFSAVTARGSAVSTTSNNTIAMSPSANLTVGKLVIVSVVSTNFATADGASTDHSLADTAGNSWTKIAEYTETSGVAHDGTAISTWRTVVTTQIGTGDTITCTLSGNSAEKVISTFEATRNTAMSIAVAQTGVGQTAIEASVSGLTSREYLLVGHGGARGSDNSKTPDADYTELFDLRSRNNAAATTQHVVTRIATLTGDTCTSTAWTNTAPIFLLHAIYEVAVAPTVTTQAVGDISTATATGNGTVTSDGGATVTERGVVANTTGTPTTSDLKFTASAGGTGAYTADMTGLDPDTHYYVRAYAINSEGTAYGSEVEFDTDADLSLSVSIYPSDHIANGGEPTTAQLSAPAGKTTGDFQAGRIQDDANGWSGDLAADTYIEMEVNFLATVVGIYQFRIVADGVALDGYDQVAQVTVEEANVISLSATITAVSSTPDDASLQIARPLTATATAVSSTPDDTGLSVARSLAATTTAQSITPDDAVLDIARQLAATITAVTSTPDDAILLIARLLTATITAQSSTPDTAVLSILRQLAAQVTAVSSTPDTVVLSIARQLAATITAVSAAPDDAILSIARQLTATITAASQTPDDVVLAIAGLISLAATITAVSATPDDASLSVARSLAATATAQSATPDGVSLSVHRPIAATITAQSNTPDTAVLSILRQLAAQITAVSSTPDATLSVLRQLTAIITAVSATPDDVVLAIAGVISLAATITAVSSTPDDASLSVARELSATVSAQSNTSTAVLSILRQLAATITAVSATPDDANLRVGNLISLLATITAQSSTPDDATLSVLRQLSAQVTAGTGTSEEARLAVTRQLTATLTAETGTPDTAVLSVLRQLTATISAETNTPDDVILSLVLISGLLRAIFAARQPSIEASSKQPTARFTGRSGQS